MGSQRFILTAAILSVTLSIGACSDPEEPVGPARITRIQAYLCVVRNATECQGRGEAIPIDQTPPPNEAFMVWAWHPGYNTTNWRVVSPIAVDTARRVALDSVGIWVHLNGALAKQYTIQVQIQGPNNTIVSQDSLRWVYP